MAKRNIMRAFKLDEISGVNFPCQEPALVAIIKRAPDAPLNVDDSGYAKICKRTFSPAYRAAAEKSGDAMPGGNYPIADAADLTKAITVSGVGKGSNPAIRTHIVRRARALSKMDLIPDAWKTQKAVAAELLDQIDAAYALRKALTFDDQQATQERTEAAQGLMNEVHEAVGTLCTVLYEIAGDDGVDDKAAAMQQALVEFSEHVKSIAPEGIETGMVAAALQKAGYRVNDQGGVELTKNGADTMKLSELAKALKISVAKDADDETIAKAIAEALAKANLAKEGDEDDVEKLRKYTADLEKMSGKHKDFMSGGGKMPKGGKEAFAAMSPDERDKHVAANAPDDEDDGVEKAIKKGLAFKDTTTGVVVYAKNCDPALFAVMKSNSEATAAMAVRLAKNEEDAAIAKATALIAPLKHVGKTDDLAALVHRIGKRDAKDGAALIKLLEGLDNTIEKSGLLTEVGSAIAGRVGKAAVSIDEQAKALKAQNPTWSIEKCRVQVRKASPDLRAEEEQERAADRAKTKKAA